MILKCDYIVTLYMHGIGTSLDFCTNLQHHGPNL